MKYFINLIKIIMFHKFSWMTITSDAMKLISDLALMLTPTPASYKLKISLRPSPLSIKFLCYIEIYKLTYHH